MRWNVRRSDMLLVGCIGALVCAVSATGCGNGDDDGDSSVATGADAGGAETSVTGTTGPATDGGVLPSDGQIFQIVHLANLGEVSEAELAERQASHPSVQGVASQIDYSVGIEDARLEGYAEMANLAAVDSPESLSIAAATTADLAQLTPLSGSAFDSAYLAAQEKADQSLLNLIDTELLAETGAPILLTYVQDTRALLATHLAQIQALESDSGGAL